MNGQIADSNLMEFCGWFSKWHGSTTSPSVFTTCLCGHFHTYPKAANQLLKRCIKLRYAVVDGDNLTIVNNNKKQ